MIAADDFAAADAAADMLLLPPLSFDATPAAMPERHADMMQSVQR